MAPRSTLPGRLGPPSGLETFALANLVATSGTGITLTSSVFFFVQVAGIPVGTVAAAMSIGALVGLSGMPVVGRVAAAKGAKRVYLWLLGMQSLALLSWQLATVPAVAFGCLALSLTAERGVNAVIGGFIADLDIPRDERPRGRAYLRSVTNVGLAIGGGIAATGLAVGSETALRIVVVLAAAMPVGAALLVSTCGTTPSARPRDASGPVRAKPFRDRRFVALAITNGLMAVHLDMLAVGLPLVLTASGVVPTWIGGVAIAINAVLVVLLQVPASRRIQSAGASTGSLVAAGSMTASLVLLASVINAPEVVGMLLLLGWILCLTLTELTQSGVEFIVSYDAAPHWAHIEYQAAYAFGRGAVRAAAPAALACAVLNGWPVWISLTLLCGGAGVAHALLAKGVRADG